MLELKNIVKKYNNKKVLDGISLNIDNGEIVSLLGQSGSGKTTLLNIILGLTDIDEGKIIFNGEDITRKSMKDRGFNIVFQDYALFPNLNAYENIVYGLKNNFRVKDSFRKKSMSTIRWTKAKSCISSYIGYKTEGFIIRWTS